MILTKGTSLTWPGRRVAMWVALYVAGTLLVQGALMVQGAPPANREQFGKFLKLKDLAGSLGNFTQNERKANPES